MGRLPGLAAKRLPRATLTRQIPLPDVLKFPSILDRNSADTTSGRGVQVRTTNIRWLTCPTVTGLIEAHASRT
jgi:hypothetical protein